MYETRIVFTLSCSSHGAAARSCCDRLHADKSSGRPEVSLPGDDHVQGRSYEMPRLKDGQALFKGLRERLGSDLDPIYETFETPYTVYSVFKGHTKIGVVHGVNVPGKGGVI